MTPVMFPMAERWVLAALGYGCARKAVRLRDARVSQYDFKTHVDRERQLLVSEKVVFGAVGALAAVYGWPVMLVKDVVELESYVRGTDPPVFEAPSTHVGHLIA